MWNDTDFLSFLSRFSLRVSAYSIHRVHRVVWGHHWGSVKLIFTKFKTLFHFYSNLRSCQKNVTIACKSDNELFLSYLISTWYSFNEDLHYLFYHTDWGTSPHVGQNIHQGQPNWDKVMSDWWGEVKQYTYGASNSAMVGHYTQVLLPW